MQLVYPKACYEYSKVGYLHFRIDESLWWEYRRKWLWL